MEDEQLAELPKRQPIRVLFVEDDPSYREALGAELAERGFVVQSYANDGLLLGSLDVTADADVIILDWGLPKTSGIDLLSQLRRHGVNLPVVFLTGRTLPRASPGFRRGHHRPDRWPKSDQTAEPKPEQQAPQQIQKGQVKEAPRPVQRPKSGRTPLFRR